MSLDAWIDTGRRKKIQRFAIAIDEDARADGLDPLSIDGAADVADRLAAATDEYWKTRAKEMGEKKPPSDETRRQIVNLYRIRASLPELPPLVAPEHTQEGAPDIAAGFTEHIDLRCRKKGNDPLSAAVAAQVAEVLEGADTADRWWAALAAEVCTDVPGVEVQRLVLNVYRWRAGLGLYAVKENAA